MGCVPFDSASICGVCAIWGDTTEHLRCNIVAVYGANTMCTCNSQSLILYSVLPGYSSISCDSGKFQILHLRSKTSLCSCVVSFFRFLILFLFSQPVVSDECCSLGLLTPISITLLYYLILEVLST